MELDPEDVPFAVEQGNDLIRGSQAFVDRETDVQVFKLLWQYVHGHAVVASNLLVSDEAKQNQDRFHFEFARNWIVCSILHLHVLN